MLLYAAFPNREDAFQSRGAGASPGKNGAGWCVKRLDVGETVGLGSPAGIETAQVNQLAFQAAEKVFRHSVVVGVTLAGHALPDAQEARRSRKAAAAYWTPRSLWKISPGQGAPGGRPCSGRPG